MTLIEDREAFEPRILGKRVQELDTGLYDESGGSDDDEYLIANDEYTDGGENNNNRDFFSLPTLGLNYLNNLNLSLNLNLNLRNTSLWRIYENSPLPKSGFLSNYLGKHEEVDSLDIHDHDDITPESRGYFTLANFLRHAFQSYEEEFSDEAILERVRINQNLWTRSQLERSSLDPLSDFNFKEKKRAPSSCTASIYDDDDKQIDSESIESVHEHHHKLEENTVEIEEVYEHSNQEEMSQITGSQLPKRMPFYNRVEIPLWTTIKIWVFSILLLPIKLVGMIITLLLALLVASIGMWGTTLEEIENKPLSKWRRGMRVILADVVMRSFVFCSGFWWNIKETGKRATPEEAPIFAVAPHSSYFDAFAVILLGAPSVVAKLSTKNVPIFGKLVTFTQAVYVSRESKGNRKQVMENLKERARGVYQGSGMPQLFIFPEGTCSNRSSLIKFKIGAFVAGVPIQPVLIRYPNEFDPITWTFDGPSTYKNIWYALATPYNKIEIEYLPVYVPSEEEKNDPGLYAENLRRVMSEALGIPVSEYQYEDGAMLASMRASSLVKKLRAIHRAKKSLGLNGSQIESAMIYENSLRKIECNYGFQKFQQEFFLVDDEDTVIPEVQAAFNSFKTSEEADEIDIRTYLIFACILYPEKSMMNINEMAKWVCELYYGSADEITEADVKQMLDYVFFGQPSALEGRNSTGECVPLSSDGVSQRMSRHLEFAKLFADEVTERLSATYPRRSERDKPQRKQKAD